MIYIAKYILKYIQLILKATFPNQSSTRKLSPTKNYMSNYIFHSTKNGTELVHFDARKRS